MLAYQVLAVVGVVKKTCVLQECPVSVDAVGHESILELHTLLDLPTQQCNLGEGTYYHDGKCPIQSVLNDGRVVHVQAHAQRVLHHQYHLLPLVRCDVS